MPEIEYKKYAIIVQQIAPLPSGLQPELDVEIAGNKYRIKLNRIGSGVPLLPSMKILAVLPVEDEETCNG